jgi:sigma-B regulation protein RsbU (phosphoserine phosphatase)
MLLRSNGVYTPAYALGYRDATPAAIPATSKLAEALRRNREPVRVFLDDDQSWIHRAGLPPEEVDSLRLLDTRLLLPMAVKDKLLGFISLGPKRSEEAYSGSDIRLLKSVAMQTGLALENSHLTQAIAHEAAHRERLLLDLEIAREVQERLLPQTLPEVPGLDYAAACRPARAVGGDYYDFLALDSGEFGIAIGDVSGKGISAALLMASLQASLRSQAISAPPDLAALMLNMNRLTHAATASNRYATFFYGRYNPRTRDLAYVNAGHNAPLVARGGEVLRLEEGGPPIGLLGNASYRQASVKLMPDDMLVLFTDGVSDAMDSKDEEWGEDRLLAAMKANRQATAAGILLRIFEDADAFTAGAPQHDDMTLIVVKIFDQAV